MRQLVLVAGVWGVGTLAAASGCYSYRRATPPVPEGAVVRFRFDSPSALHVAFAGRDTLRLGDVTQLEGRVLARRGDTLHLALRSVRTLGTTDPSVPGGGTAVVASTPGQVAEVKRLAKGRTALAAYLGISVAFGVMMSVYWAAGYY